MRLWRTLLLAFLLGSLLLVRGDNSLDDDDLDDDEIGHDDVADIEDEPDIPTETAPPKEKPDHKPPKANPKVFFADSFDSVQKRWIVSQAKKDGVDEAIAKYEGKWEFEEPSDSVLTGDVSLVLKSKAKHHAISAKMDKAFEFTGNPFIVQYEVRFKNGMECGGAYIKLLSKNDRMDLKHFHDKTPYTVMFGPDKCGLDHKLHFIFRHQNPKTGNFEEKHAKKPTANIDSYFTDKKTHLYTLIVKPDNSFEVYIDKFLVNSGNLLEDVSPAVNPPKEIEDSNDNKPADWDSREKIADPDAAKPEDWDESEPEKIIDEDSVMPADWLEEEPELVPDPDAKRPEDWDDDMDGEWEAPMISNPKCKEASGCGEWKPATMKNPKYKGKWKAPMIDNPNYQGIWKPQQITNPDYFEDLTPYKMTPIAAIGLELWSMTDDIVFDNFIITDDKAIADEWATQTWDVKHNQERANIATGKSVVDAVMDATRERPWLWAVFLVVIVLPIVLIIAYCCFSGSKGVFQSLMDATEGRPWLWAVYAVVLLLPIVLLSICLCPKSGPIKPEDIAAADRKKTDEASPDDELAEENTGEETVETTDALGGGDAKANKSSKAQLEAKEEDQDNEDNEDNEEEEEEVEEEVEEEDQVVSTGSPRKSPRKRKARKE